MTEPTDIEVNQAIAEAVPGWYVSGGRAFERIGLESWERRCTHDLNAGVRAAKELVGEDWTVNGHNRAAIWGDDWEIRIEADTPAFALAKALYRVIEMRKEDNEDNGE